MHAFLQMYSWSCIHYLFYQQVLIVLEDVITLETTGKKRNLPKSRNISEAKLKQKIIAALITLIFIIFRLNFSPFLAQQMNSLNSKVGKIFN